MPAPQAADCYMALRLCAQGLLEHCQQLVAGQNALWWPHLGWLATPVSRDWITCEPTLQAVQQRIAAAAECYGRDPDHIKLLAVSKQHPARAVQDAAPEVARKA